LYAFPSWSLGTRIKEDNQNDEKVRLLLKVSWGNYKGNYVKKSRFSAFPREEVYLEVGLQSRIEYRH